MLEEGNHEGWSESPVIVGLGLLAVIALTTFVVHELETPTPTCATRPRPLPDYPVPDRAAGLVPNDVFGATAAAHAVSACRDVLAAQRVSLADGISAELASALAGRRGGPRAPRRN